MDSSFLIIFVCLFCQALGFSFQPNLYATSLATEVKATTPTPFFYKAQNGHSSGCDSGLRNNNNMATSRRSLAVKRGSSRKPPGRNPSASSLGSASIMDVDELNGSAPNSQHGSTQLNNMQVTVSRSHSDLESLQPMEVSGDTQQQTTPFWVTVLDNPSLRMGRVIVLVASCVSLGCKIWRCDRLAFTLALTNLFFFCSFWNEHHWLSSTKRYTAQTFQL